MQFIIFKTSPNFFGLPKIPKNSLTPLFYYYSSPVYMLSTLLSIVLIVQLPLQFVIVFCLKLEKEKNGEGKNKE